MSTDTPHDSSYKQLFSHPDMVRDLLTGFVAGPWVQAARFDTLERVQRLPRVAQRSFRDGMQGAVRRR